MFLASDIYIDASYTTLMVYLFDYFSKKC